VSKEKQSYWGNVDLYIGGTEHATGHLLYSRFWTKFLFDRGYVTVDEPYQKLVNQGMIQGVSSLAYRVVGENKYVSYGLRKDYHTSPIHVDISLVKDDKLDIEAFKKWRPDAADAEFVLENGAYICGSEVEKMSKSKYNVVNPDDMIAQYGADTLRMYEMFLGPLEQSKPWNTNGIDGVFKFLRKLWRLFHDEDGQLIVTDNAAEEAEWKILHKTIKKVQDDIEQLSFNTSVSSFMICVNELTSLKCHKREVLEKLVVILSPFAPHIAEELWHRLGYQESVVMTTYPDYDDQYLVEDSFEYPVSVNGKVRAKMQFPLDKPKEELEREVLASEQIQKWTAGKAPKRMIIVPGKIINVVV
jgi:leucyl-tRNA synthetase